MGDRYVTEPASGPPNRVVNDPGPGCTTCRKYAGEVAARLGPAHERSFRYTPVGVSRTRLRAHTEGPGQRRTRLRAHAEGPGQRRTRLRAHAEGPGQGRAKVARSRRGAGPGAGQGCALTPRGRVSGVQGCALTPRGRVSGGPKPRAEGPPTAGPTQPGNPARLCGVVVLGHRVVEALQGLAVLGEVTALLSLLDRFHRAPDLLQGRGFGPGQLYRSAG